MLHKTEDKRQDNFFDVCSQCRTSYSCCHGTRPPITKQRKKIIEEYLKKTNSSLAGTFSETDYIFPRESPEGYCIFHDMKTRKCLIHTVKPETCIAGPVTFDINRRTGRIEWFLKTDRICQLAGMLYANKETLEKHLVSAKGELLALVRDLDSGSLKAILKKDEPETFKMGEDTIEDDILNKLK